MNQHFVSALEDMLTSIAMKAATEAIRQHQMQEQQRLEKDKTHGLLLRSHEAAECLAISTATLERWTRSGELPCLRLGRSVRYSVESLREWIKKKETQASKSSTAKAVEKKFRGND
jgi:excisionase family DNA binding protein